MPAGKIYLAAPRRTSAPPRRRRIRRKRKYNKNKISTVLLRGPSLVPDRILVKIKYFESLEFTGTGINYHSFRGNSFYDPDESATGHQPLGFDQYAAFYNKYRVYGTKMKLRIVNNDSTQVDAALLASVGAFPTPTNFTEVCEQPYSVVKQLGTVNANAKAVLKMYMSSSKIFGDKVKEDLDYAALVTASPAKVWRYQMYFTNYAPLDAINVSALIEMEMYGEFFDRKELAQS